MQNVLRSSSAVIDAEGTAEIHAVQKADVDAVPDLHCAGS
jgi:hypothetical protein